MVFLFALLAATHGQSCNYATQSTCNGTISPCYWQSNCVTIAGSTCGNNDPTTCMQTANCKYINHTSSGYCTSVCDGLNQADCASNSTVCMDQGTCYSSYCSYFSGGVCPSSCFTSQTCTPTGGFDACLTHSAAVCGSASGCVWKNDICQSSCWSRSTSTCASMQGCALSPATCSDSAPTGPQCWANLTSTDCEMTMGCAFNQTGNGLCGLSCNFQSNQLSCESSSGCTWSGSCQEPSHLCGSYSDEPTCSQHHSCSWGGTYCSSICNRYYSSATACVAVSGCSWQGSCHANTYPVTQCYQFPDPVDCLDTSTGRNCRASGYCQPIVYSPLCNSITEMTACGGAAGCAWQSYSPGQGYCGPACSSIDDAGQCGTSPAGCIWNAQCSEVYVPPVLPVCMGLNQTACLANSPYCDYQPGCHQAGGGVSTCYTLQNATACWADSGCFYGAGQCFPRCSFLTQTQCSSEAGCSWQSSCTSGGTSVTISFGGNPNVCSIHSSPVFSYMASPCQSQECNAAWPNPTYTPECNTLAKTYCCGTNSTTCAQDNQCYEKYFGDGPLCNWKCDFQTAVTDACKAVGQCSTTSTPYHQTVDFSTNSMASFDLGFAGSGMNSPIVKNGALCANATSDDPVSGIFWKDDLNGDLATGTTISFDFTTYDFTLAFGVIFSTAHAVQVGESAQGDSSFGDCVYLATCMWNTQPGAGCNLMLGNILGGFKYSLPSVTGPWVDLVPGNTYTATIVKSSTFAITLTVSGVGIQPKSVGPINVGRKFTRFGLMMFNFDATTDSCIDNLAVTSSTCPTGSFSTAAPVASLPTMSPVSRAPTARTTTHGPTAPPTTHRPTMSPVTHAPTAAPVPTTTAPSSPPTTPSPTSKPLTKTNAPKKSASAPLGSFLSIVLVAVGCLLF